MAEYIEREAILKKQYNSSPLKDLSFAEMVVDVRDIEEAPTADVVSVVRCKDCRHRYIPKRCALWYGHYDGKDYYVDRGDNFYCSYGERKGSND
jgi:hypothetical protein